MKLETGNLKFVITCLLLLFASNVSAIDFVQTNLFIVAETNALTDETWVSAQAVNVSGTVSNDLFASAPKVELYGIFSGDTWGVGDSINAGGVFRRSTRLLSRIAQIQGTHYGSVMAAATTVKIDRAALLYGDLLGLGENVIVEGSVGGKTRIIAQRVTLGGKLDGDISLLANEIIVLPGTILNGNLTYQAPDELVLPGSVELGGELIRQFAPISTRWLKESLATHFMFALAALLTGLVFFGLFPRYAGVAVHNLRSSNALCSLAGFASLVIMPMAAFFLIFTIVGLPLSLLILLFYGILLYLSKVIVALWIGMLITKQKTFNKKKAAGPLSIGLLILYSITSIEAASMLVNIAITIFGLGALTVALFKKPVLVINADELPKPTQGDPS